jgi:pimeloyl-ACP methyl ester carboxylesterase
MDTSAPEAYQGGEGPPLVLLHGLNMSWRAWAPVLPLLSERFRVYAPTLPGHRGGPALRTDGQAGVEELTWMVREQLAAAGITAAHLVGNSLGGAVALTLAEAGAARSVTAFSPAGGWRGRREFHRLALLLRAGRLAMGLPWAGGMLAFPALRAVLLRA